MEILLGVLVLVGLLIIYSSFCWGFVAYKFYGWFVLPSITTLPNFTITEFIGFVLFVSVFTSKKVSDSIKDEYKDKSSNWIQILVNPWVTLFCGWLIHSLFF